MKDYYQLVGYYKGNALSFIDNDGKHSDFKKDHSNIKAFNSLEEAQKFLFDLDTSDYHPDYKYYIEPYDPGSVFLVDGWNNNKVIGEFDSLDDLYEFLDKKEFTEDWENVTDTFEEYYEGFFEVEWREMREAVKKHGSRKLNYWT